MAYVPPHLRNGKSYNAGPELPSGKPVSLDGSLTLDEITNYFWPVDNHDGSNDEEQNKHVEKKGRTLHDSADTPGELAYLFIFQGANPKWNTDHTIFTKSRLDLLPRVQTVNGTSEVSLGAAEGLKCTNDDATENDGQHSDHQARLSNPIAVFQQQSRKRQSRAYRFEGWFKIEDVSFLQPRSNELVRMLEQKWSKRQRAGDDWNESLRHEWAVVKLAKDTEADTERGHLKIEGRPEQQPSTPPAHAKSVNELLSEMRLKGSAATAVDARYKMARCGSSL